MSIGALVDQEVTPGLGWPGGVQQDPAIGWPDVSQCSPHGPELAPLARNVPQCSPHGPELAPLARDVSRETMTSSPSTTETPPSTTEPSPFRRARGPRRALFDEDEIPALPSPPPELAAHVSRETSTVGRLPAP